MMLLGVRGREPHTILLLIKINLQPINATSFRAPS